MSRIRLVLASPASSVTRVLSAYSVETEPVELAAVLLRGEEDISHQARFSWSLSWDATYALYERTIAAGSRVTIPLELGGERLSVTAEHKGRRYIEAVSASIGGENPTVEQVVAAVGDDAVLKAIRVRLFCGDARFMSGCGSPTI